MKTNNLLQQLLILTAIAGIMLLLSSCSDSVDDYVSKYCPGSCTVIKGHVTQGNNAEPVAGATITVEWQLASYPLGSTTRQKAITTTDANGNYDLRFLLRDDELQNGEIVLKTSFNADNYTSCNDGSRWYTTELTRDTTIIQNYAITPKGRLNLMVAQNEPVQAGDRFTATFKYKLTARDSDSCTYVISSRYPYLELNDILLLPVNVPVLALVEKLKAGTRTIEKTTLVLQPEKSNTYEITF